MKSRFSDNGVIIAIGLYKLTIYVAIRGFSTQTLREGYTVMSLRYNWPPKRGTSVGLAIDTPASRESELLRLTRRSFSMNPAAPISKGCFLSIPSILTTTQ